MLKSEISNLKSFCTPSNSTYNDPTQKRARQEACKAAQTASSRPVHIGKGGPMRRIAVINQKGGVGKTTSTVNIGVGLARAGHRVLLIDLDPQAHLSLQDRKSTRLNSSHGYISY